jgi:hypothetical protein
VRVVWWKDVKAPESLTSQGPEVLAAALEPALRSACREQLDGAELGQVRWFHAAWSAGGAATGFATVSRAGACAAEVMVKLPVGPAEYRWTTQVAAKLDEPGTPVAPARLPTPRVYAHGSSLGGHDLAWLLVERLPGETLKQGFTSQCVLDLIGAANRWHAAAGAIAAPSSPPQEPDWEGQIARAREACKANHFEHSQHWNDVLKKVHRAVPRLAERWGSRSINTWCHGDLHPGNAMRRAGDGSGPGACVLIDLGMVHAGHWVEDAVYLERLFWAQPEALGGVKPVSVLAKLRRECGLGAADEYTELANVRRVLMGATAPAFLHREGHPKYLRAALEHVEKLLPQVPH